jgi:hypothetical protein
MTASASRKHLGTGRSVSREPVAFKPIPFMSKYLGAGCINVFAYTRYETERARRIKTASLITAHVIRSTPRIVRAMSPLN